jgi:Lambda phage tail tape-measure protein (Tape_meas_lam_C)
MADTAALVVALSAQLTRFEKDMKDAAGIADRQTKVIEDRFAKMNAEINNQFSKLTQGFAGHLGPLGSVLSSIGPVGLGIAAGIGAAVVAFEKLSESVQRFVELQVKLRETSETTGLTTAQLNALNEAGAKVNLTTEQTQYIIERLAISVEQLRTKGEGPLFDALQRIDTGLLRQVASAKDVREAIDLVAQAYGRLAGTQAGLTLAGAVGGGRRQAGPAARLLGEITQEGGVDEAKKKLDELGRGFDENLNKKLYDTKNQIQEINRQIDEMIGKMGSQAALEEQKTWLTATLQVIKAIDAARQGYFISAPPKPEAPVPSLRDRLGPFSTAPAQAPQTLSDLQDKYATDEAIRNATIELNLLKQRNAARGDSVTLTEQITQKELELATLRAKSKEVTPEDIKRGYDAAVYAQNQLIEATRERLGVATEAQIVDAKLAQIQFDLAKGLINSTEAAKAQALAFKEGKEQAEQLAVRASRLPELTRFGIDAAKPFKQFDQLATQTFSNFENSMADAVTGSKSLADAFKSMADSLIRDLVRISLRMAVTGPLSSALSGLFGGVSAPGLTSPFGGLAVPTFPRQGGGPVFSGTPYVVGEHGRELFVPHTSGQIIPGQIAGRGSPDSGLTVTVNNFASGQVDTTQERRQKGPNAEELVIGIVKRTLASSDADAAQRARFGLRPSKVR